MTLGAVPTAPLCSGLDRGHESCDLPLLHAGPSEFQEGRPSCRTSGAIRTAGLEAREATEGENKHPSASHLKLLKHAWESSLQPCSSFSSLEHQELNNLLMLLFFRKL